MTRSRALTLRLTPPLVGILRALVRTEIRKQTKGEKRMREKFGADYDPTTTSLPERMALLRQLDGMLRGHDDHDDEC